jgi:hypothetical protein
LRCVILHETHWSAHFVFETRPSRSAAIELIEAEPHGQFEPNWESYMQAVPPGLSVKQESAAKELKRQHPELDWSGETEHRDGERRVAR